MAGAKYPETILVKLPEGTKSKITSSGVSNQNAWVRGLIESALVGGAVGAAVREGVRSRPDKVKPAPVKPVTGMSAAKVEQRFLSAGRRMASELKEQDKAALLALVRERVVSSRDAEKLLSLPGLRYRNAEKELMAAGTLWVTDGVMETFDE